VKRVVLVTSHYLESKRKAGFHWMADALWRSGWDVLFFTESISWLSWVRHDQRFQYPIFREANQLRQVAPRLASYVWLTPFHPINLRWSPLNRLSKPVLSLYRHFALPRVQARLAGADLFVFDSTHGLFLFERFKKLNPGARFVYRVSDDIGMMRHHPMVAANEARVAPRFDLISVPCDAIQRRFAHLPQVILQKHGLRKELFDVPRPNPYRGAGPFALYVGYDYFDHDFLRRALRLFPTWSFHVFGAIAGLPAAANLTTYGERPFDEIVPYLQHADIGLQTRSYCPGAECLTDSLKMHQYTYCGLPIVAPRFLQTGRPHVFNYEPGNDGSIRAALEAAARFDRRRVPRNEVRTWQGVVDRLVA